MSEQHPTPLIPKDHPLRALYEADRQAELLNQQASAIRIAALNRALGYDEGNAKERRRLARAGVWRNEDAGEYKAAS